MDNILQKAWSLNFVNHPCFLLCVLIGSCIVFCIFFLPKEKFNKFSDSRIEKRLGKNFDELARENSINKDEYKNYIEDIHLEIKQTFTFSLLLAFATALASKELKPETMLTTFSTVYIYTFMFTWKDFWHKKRCLFLFALVLFGVNIFLLYQSATDNGEYWWVLSAILSIFTIVFQAVKYRIKYPNLTGNDSKESSTKIPNQT